jgi:hypothetical protein
MDHRRVKRIIVLKERVRDARRAELASAEHACSKAQEATDQAASMLQDLSDRLVSSTLVQGSELELGSRLVDLARRDHRRSQEVLRTREAEREERARAVARATRDVKSLGVLEERLAAEARREELRREQETAEDAGRGNRRSR